MDNSITFMLLKFARFTWSASYGDCASPLPSDQREVQHKELRVIFSMVRVGSMDKGFNSKEYFEI